MERAPLWESLGLGLELDGFYNLSFWGDDLLDSVERVTEVSPIPNARVRVARLGSVRSLGYDPYPSEPWPHITVRFEEEPTDNDLDDLVALFGSPIPNPHPWG